MIRLVRATRLQVNQTEETGKTIHLLDIFSSQEKYRENFKNMWRIEKAIILMNFTHSFFDESFGLFQSFVSSCSPEVIEIVRNYFEVKRKLRSKNI